MGAGLDFTSFITRGVSLIECQVCSLITTTDPLYLLS